MGERFTQSARSWRIRQQVIGEGTFVCPLEGGDRPYTRLHIRRWWSPAGVPIVPSSRLGDYIVCDSCQEVFTDDLLEVPTAAAMSMTIDAAARSLACAILSRGHWSDMAMQKMVRPAMAQFLHQDDLAPDRLLADDLHPLLEEVAKFVEEPGRRAMLEAAVQIAKANGTLSQPHAELLVEAGRSLDLELSVVRDILVD